MALNVHSDSKSAHIYEGRHSSIYRLHMLMKMKYELIWKIKVKRFFPKWFETTTIFFWPDLLRYKQLPKCNHAWYSQTDKRTGLVNEIEKQLSLQNEIVYRILVSFSIHIVRCLLTRGWLILQEFEGGVQLWVTYSSSIFHFTLNWIYTHFLDKFAN